MEVLACVALAGLAVAWTVWILINNLIKPTSHEVDEAIRKSVEESRKWQNYTPPTWADDNRAKMDRDRVQREGLLLEMAVEAQKERRRRRKARRRSP